MSGAGVVVTDAQPRMTTVPGKVAGIVSLDPFTVQCHDCLRTAWTSHAKPALCLVVLGGWQFHVCEERSGVRRCPECLAAAVAACPSQRCKW